MSAKEEFDEAMNMLDVYEHLSEVHIKAVKAYVSELQAENEKLAKERESAKSQFEFFEQGWAARAREAIRNYNKLRARVEGSPKVAVLIYNDKIQHGSIGDDEETAWCAYCEYSHDSKDDLIANGLTAREVYAVPVEADENAKADLAAVTAAKQKDADMAATYYKKYTELCKRIEACERVWLPYMFEEDLTLCGNTKAWTTKCDPDSKQYYLTPVDDMSTESTDAANVYEKAEKVGR